MTYRRGAWYLLGRDRDREAPRMFKVARVDAPAQEIGKPGSYQVPDVDLDAAWGRLEPRQADTEAIVAIRPGRAAELRRRGRPVEHTGTVPAGYEVYAVGYARVADLVGELCAHGADAAGAVPGAHPAVRHHGTEGRRREPGMTSAEQVARLLALVPYLQSHPDAELGTTADVFGVSTEQLLEDLNVLWYCGLPGGMPGDLIEIDMDTVAASGKIRLSNAEYLARPMRFTPDEAMSLVVALRAVRELAGRARRRGHRLGPCEAGTRHRRTEPARRRRRRLGGDPRTPCRCRGREGGRRARLHRRRPRPVQPPGGAGPADRPRRLRLPAGVEPRARGVAHLPPRPDQ